MNKGQITFKAYSMEQMNLLPPRLDELIPKHHLVQVVNRVVDELDIEPLLAKYIRRRDQQLSSAHDVESLTCSTCLLKPKCTQAKGNRQMQVGFELRRYRQQAKDNLLSEQGHCLAQAARY